MRHLRSTFRNLLDIPQRELADFLQVSQSCLALYEKGQRSLPTSALLRLVTLEKAFGAAQNIKLSTESYGVELKLVIERLQKRINECFHSAGMLKKLLDSMRSMFPLLHMKKQALELLKATDCSEGDGLWIQLQQNKMEKQLAETGPVQQIMVEHQINSLEAEAAAAGAMIQSLEQQ